MTERNPFHQWINLGQPRLGTRVVYATDEFFAAKERLIDAAEPVFVADKYDDHGKWMDGWESRRKREPGHDYCVIRLGVPGILHGVDINTRYFTGNYPPGASLEGCRCDAELPADDVGWKEIIPETPLAGDTHHWLPVAGEGPFTHLRFHIYPDGGVARLRLYGEVSTDAVECGDEVVDLLALENGGRALICSDEHYGSMHNLNLPGRGLNMGDGWETARRRGPGNDWVILALGAKGIVEKIEVDTAHFKGNYPDRVAIDAVCLVGQPTPEALVGEDIDWQPLLTESRLEMDQQHVFGQLQKRGPVTHIRMRIFPDGGVSRLRLMGRRT
ncbi:MAG: allantoicase [Gammaproteobacteria bacterium]|nr:allantoicase [Gammaproteobacteria bacterium]